MTKNISFAKPFAALLLIVAAIFPFAVSAHPVVNHAMENTPAQDVVWFYIKMGILHIIPQGFDHILFVTSLCLLSRNIKTILWQASAFTVAHSITLALSMKNIIVAPGPVVEPIIALSIVFVAVENILLSELKPWRVLIVFFFGLVHGLGFASALNSVGLPQDKFFTSVVAFNIGVELGQIGVILLVFGLIIIPFGKFKDYKKRIVYPLSLIIALIAAYWTVQRIALI